jgi:peptidoglycan/xylan/chitin deacetylase (PgdA/CDA1 family)
MKATILLFHRVNPVRDVLWDPMAPELFEKIMQFVSKKFEVLSLNELCLEKPITKKPPLAITFDDGFRDYIDYALPVLKKYNFHSTIYVVTDCVDQNIPTWTYVMDYLFYHTKKLSLPQFDYGEDGAAFAVYNWQNKDEQIAYCRKFKQSLKKVSNTKRNAIMRSFIAGFDDVSVPKDLMLTWDELRSFKNEQIGIGSHSVSHPPLATIEDDLELEREIKMSGEIIKEHIGYFPASISYPVGSYSQRVKDASEKAGYKIGLALNQRSYNPQGQDLFDVPRLELYNDSFLRNKLKMYGIEAAIKSIIGK